jgi:adenosylcobinamide-GDP ribazoletransferase
MMWTQKVERGLDYPQSPIKAWREAASFLTTFIGSDGSISPRALRSFPAVGFSLGLIEGSLWSLLKRSRFSSVAPSIVVFTDLALTGGLHLDGLADSADGLFAHVPAKDRLEIMSEPSVGTFGVLALIASFISRRDGLNAIEPSPLLLASVLCASRSLMVLGMCVLPSARPNGLASRLSPNENRFGLSFFVALGSIGASVILAFLAHGIRGAIGLVAGLVAGAGVLVLGRRRLGGYTGDILGAAGAVCEAIGLLAMSKRPTQ